MAAIFLESYDPKTHRNHMPEVDTITTEAGSVIIVSHGKIRLEFLSLAQIDAAVSYFEKPNVSTRISGMNGDHWEFQSWISRLPAGINNSKNRVKVLEYLRKAKSKYESDKDYVPVSA